MKEKKSDNQESYTITEMTSISIYIIVMAVWEPKLVAIWQVLPSGQRKLQNVAETSDENKLSFVN